MTDTQTTETAVETQAVNTADNVDSLPEWARAKMTQANNEAARYRNEKKTVADETRALVEAEFQVKLDAETTKFSELSDELVVSNNRYDKLIAILNEDVGGTKAVELANLVQGDTPEAITAHAKTIVGLMGKGKDRATDITQGSGNSNHIPLNGDPILRALNAAINNR
ncbi:hypothetical protein ACWF99_23540 [Nocardia sp. NPDC055002]